MTDIEKIEKSFPQGETNVTIEYGVQQNNPYGISWIFVIQGPSGSYSNATDFSEQGIKELPLEHISDEIHRTMHETIEDYITEEVLKK